LLQGQDELQGPGRPSGLPVVFEGSRLTMIRPVLSSLARRLPLLVFLLTGMTLDAQVSFDRLLRAPEEPRNWLSYSGSYLSQRYSLLRQVNPANVGNLELKWVFQAQSLQKFETTPLVVDGIMYITQSPNDVVALDAKTGRAFWVYHYTPSPAARLCCGL